MAFKNEYEESYAYAASSCSNLVARYLQKNNGMTANYNQREARLELVSWSKELFSVEKDGRELVDPYTDFLFKKIYAVGHQVLSNFRMPPMVKILSLT